MYVHVGRTDLLHEEGGPETFHFVLGIHHEFDNRPRRMDTLISAFHRYIKKLYLDVS
jgi:hypothetical protein